MTYAHTTQTMIKSVFERVNKASKKAFPRVFERTEENSEWVSQLGESRRAEAQLWHSTCATAHK